jgi:predicted Zn-dependent protease
VDKLNHLLEMLDQNPDDSFLLFALAKSYANIQDFDKAITYYERLSASDPMYIGLYLHWANALMNTHNPDQAGAILKQGIERAKSLGDFHALSELNSALMELEESN